MIEVWAQAPYLSAMMADDPQHLSRRARQRLERQFNALSRAFPSLRRPLTVIRARGWWIIRLPIALLFIAGGFLAILPVFGLWMIPTGLLLLAIDLPALRGPVSGWIVRLRRRASTWRRNRR